ncbi:uncharacterized protein PV06_08722 [Exophiala oligosperma]|uniref:Transcription factor domain-containing protein n=2 Tax=Exophiala oligosperma TaxID=215243 RepID=A0A0D2BN25_9EURO|nr:uncharacterized protein PV06_08722 [Exophiala oligosperma]KIW38897.1 hypothetical protein PV06_08722 [Exophiala oligosperma]
MLSPSHTAYLGPGTSARLIQSFLTRTANWHLSNNVQIPSCLLPDHRSHLSELQESKTASSFPINNDPRKVELHSIVPPSTQRAMIEHYLKVVVSEFKLLPTAQESSLLIHENPLKWTASNKGDPSASALIIVFAVSAALITRDLDVNLAIVSLRSRDDIHKLALEDGPNPAQPSSTKWKCTALCALALCELICPTSGQLWDFLGRAAASMEDLQEGYKFERSTLDTDLRRLEHTILKLESLATTHFRRPSLFFDIRLQLYLEDIPTLDLVSDELYVAGCLRSISHALGALTAPNEVFLEGLIPLSLQVTDPSSGIGLASAKLYLALHCLLTNIDTPPESGIFDIPSPRMVHIIAQSASVIIDRFTQLNDNNRIISIWMAAERVLEAGAIWVISLVHQQQSYGQRSQSAAGIRATLSPVVKVSSLLASFAARWTPGSAHLSTWETVVDLLWAMV